MVKHTTTLEKERGNRVQFFIGILGRETEESGKLEKEREKDAGIDVSSFLPCFSRSMANK